MLPNDALLGLNILLIFFSGLTYASTMDPTSMPGVSEEKKKLLTRQETIAAKVTLGIGIVTTIANSLLTLFQYKDARRAITYLVVLIIFLLFNFISLKLSKRFWYIDYSKKITAEERNKILKSKIKKEVVLLVIYLIVYGVFFISIVISYLFSK